MTTFRHSAPGFSIPKLAVCGAAMLVATPLTATPKGQSRPNLLVVLGDDIGWSDLSLHGGATPTPRIDALAAQGVELTDFMVSPLSSPSRSMLLTACHYLRTNQGPKTDGSLDVSELTIARTFQAAGYGTALFGKWHNSYDPQTPEFVKYLSERGARSREKGICVLEYGFDTSWNYYGGGSDYHTRQTFEGFNTWWNGCDHRPDETGWTENMITSRAIEYMAASREQGKPFFCYVACELLHAPYQPLWEDYTRVPEALIPISGRLSREEFELLSHQDNTRASEWPEEHMRSVYSAMTIAHDRCFGRLMDALDSLALADNTIVVYFTDNGATPQGSNLPFRGGKHTIWEGGVHVPCMVRWPGHIPAGSTWGGLAGAMELMPTLAAMAGINVPADKPLDGLSVWPAIANGGASPVQSYYWTLDNEDALRTPQWKIVRSAGGVELYDIKRDAYESNDVAAQNPGAVKRLTALMDAWVSDTGVQLSHLPTRTAVGAAAPTGQVLEISVDLDRYLKRREDYLMVPFAGWNGEHHCQDLLVVDVMVPTGAQPKGYRLTPLDLTGGDPVMFNAKTGIDQYGRPAWDGTMPTAGYGAWERRAYGLSRNTPHMFRNFAMLIGGAKGRYTIYIDNLFVLHADGSRTVLWQDGGNRYNASKSLHSPDGYMPWRQNAEEMTALPAGFSGLTVKAVELSKLK